ncbi:MAG: hypothetical protein ACK44F_17035, partial [Roseococcus sp.]
GGGGVVPHCAPLLAWRGGAAAAARAALLALHAQGALSEEALGRLSQEFDFEENRVRRALG